jgi:hypothetical protein
MDKKIGDKDTTGSTYKVDLRSIPSISSDSEIMKMFERLSDYKKTNENLINKHNQLLRVREVAATIPEEYLRSVNLDRLISVEHTRKLIIKGCESELIEIEH